MPEILIDKSARRLTLTDQEKILFSCCIALGKNPTGHKQREGDYRTPEGKYYVCTRNEQSKFHLALGLSYPNPADADAALDRGEITDEQHASVLSAHQAGKRPPWDTPLGGFIMIHGGGTDSDWTAGCIALDNSDMDILFSLCPMNTKVRIVP